MTLTPRVVAPISSGLHRYYKPFLAPEDSFINLTDVYVRRGVVNKRPGFTTIGRTVALNTTASGFSGLSTANPMVVSWTSHPFQNGQRLWLEGATGGTFNLLNNSWYEVTSSSTNSFELIGTQPSGTNAGVVQVIDSSGLGTYSLGATFYGSIVGLMTLTNPTSPDVLVGFDQVYAYNFNASAGTFAVITSSAGGNPNYTFTGTNWEYFQGYNYYGYLWVTNWNDNVAYYDGTYLTAFTPQFSATSSDVISAARVVASFKGRLLLFNTVEGSGNLSNVNRVRWSWGASPTDSNAFRADLNNGAGYADADTDEDIVAIEFNRDQLIVFFEFSTWNLRYQGNDLLPFIWERVNIQYGCQSTNSTVALDEYICAAGERGFIGATSVGVQRIDLAIPDQPFEIDSSYVKSDNSTSASNFRRVASAQDYNLQQVIWTYPSPQIAANNGYLQHVRNDRALVYNYEEKTWSQYQVNWTIPCNFRTTNELTWGNCTTTWGDASWTWGTSFQDTDKNILVVGSDSGRVFEISDIYTQQVDDTGSTVNFSFDFSTKRYNAMLDMGVRVRIPYIDLYLESSAALEFTVAVYTDDNPNDAVIQQIVQVDSNNDVIKRVYVNAWGRDIQFEIYLNDDQLEGNAGMANFGLQGIIVWTQAAGRIVL